MTLAAHSKRSIQFVSLTQRSGLLLAPLFLFLISSCSQLSSREANESSQVRQYSAEEFFDTDRYDGASFSPDESRVLLSSDKGGVLNAYSVDLDDEKLRQETDSDDHAIFAVSYFPKDERFLFSSDEGGNELNHIFVKELGGEIRDLTATPNTKASFLGWSKDKRYFFVSTNERDPKAFDLYRYNARDYKRELLFTNRDELSLREVSPNGRWLALIKTKTNSINEMYLADLHRKATEPKLISKKGIEAEHRPFSFTPDSKNLIYGTDAHGEFVSAWRYNILSGGHSEYAKADWDISYLYFSEDGGYRVIGINADAQTKIRVTDLKRQKDLSFPEMDGAIHGVVISPSEEKMAFYLSSDKAPADLYSMELGEVEPQRLTESLNKEIRRQDLVSSEVVRYKSFDGLEIPALLYKPHQASAKNKVPAIVYVHGGPGGQTRKSYNETFQYLINQGYAVLAVNNRGSSGYGKTFFHADDKKHGDVDLKDCIWGRRYLERLDWVKPDKIAIMGGSYGGYMVAAALTFEPEAFDAGINIFGVTNWVRTLESIPPYWASFRDLLYTEIGDPQVDREKLKAKSPLFFAHKIKKPLLVVQGANDPRVLKIESDEIVEAAKKNEVPVEYLVFDDEGHGFLKKENRIEAAQAYLRFLSRYL